MIEGLVAAFRETMGYYGPLEVLGPPHLISRLRPRILLELGVNRTIRDMKYPSGQIVVRPYRKD